MTQTRAGGERLLESAPASDLKVLALAARYTGRRSLSLRAWQALRARYAPDALNQGAAFFLGRGYEEQGDATEALRWLARYLAESPAGPYASEALGRRLLLLSKSGQKTDAVSTARTYLERYPRGAYAKSARLVIQPSSRYVRCSALLVRNRESARTTCVRQRRSRQRFAGHGDRFVERFGRAPDPRSGVDRGELSALGLEVQVRVAEAPDAPPAAPEASSERLSLDVKEGRDRRTRVCGRSFTAAGRKRWTSMVLT